MVARAIWGENEAHFNPHLCKIEKWVWQSDREEYEKIEIGTTTKRYESCKISEILQSEKIF